MGHENGNLGSGVVLGRVTPALEALRDAFFFAKRTTTDPWQFAVEIHQLTSAGLSNHDLRWLIRSGLVAPATETTSDQDARRVFQKKVNLKLESATCFVITMKGIALLQANGCDAGTGVPPREGQRLQESSAARAKTPPKPRWDPGTRELRLTERVIKKFKWRAENQERVLAAFEEESWPSLIHDPLPPTADLDPKRRLHDTIKCLNRNQQSPLIRFHGDGTGEGVLWRLVATVGQADVLNGAPGAERRATIQPL